MNLPATDKRESAEKQSVQDAFLNTARKEKMAVTIYLISGAKLSGRIRSFDKFSLILDSNHQEQLVFKHAISTIAAAKPTAGLAPHAENES